MTGLQNSTANLSRPKNFLPKGHVNKDIRLVELILIEMTLLSIVLRTNTIKLYQINQKPLISPERQDHQDHIYQLYDQYVHKYTTMSFEQHKRFNALPTGEERWDIMQIF